MALTPARTADSITAGYNAILVLVWSRHLHAGTVAWTVALAHAAGTTLPWLLRRVPASGSRGMRILATVYPIVLVAAFWPELDLLRAFAPRNYDALVAGWDRALFGAHWHITWPTAVTARWMTETIHFSYFLYYGVIIVPLLALVLQHRDRELREATTQLAVVFFSCYLVFIFFPVDGPQHYQAAGPVIAPEGLFPTLVGMVRESGGSLGASFPSSHVAIAVTAAIVGWRYFPTWVGVVLSLEAVGVSVATFFTQNHYAVDAVAGVAWAALAAVAVALPKGRAARSHPRTPRRPMRAPVLWRAR
jgi:membrane-associated phospholipid phosphatase